MEGKYRVVKIVVNMGIGKNKDDENFIKSAKEDLSRICGQLPNERRSTKSIASFKLREGEVIGLSVTLRRSRMDDFFKKLTTIVFPRLRDFRGVSRKLFDGNGNYTFGISEHTVFPEIDPNKVDKIKRLQFTIVTTAKSDDAGYEFLKALGMPFRD